MKKNKEVRIYRLGHGEVNGFESNSDWPEEWFYIDDFEIYATVYETDIRGVYILDHNSTTKFIPYKKQFKRGNSSVRITKQEIIDTTSDETMFYNLYSGEQFGENTIQAKIFSKDKLGAREIRKIYNDYKGLIEGDFVR